MTVRTELWRPSPAAVAAANLTRFAEGLGFAPPDYAALHRYSIDHRGEFWQAVWDFCAVVGERQIGRAACRESV